MKIYKIKAISRKLLLPIMVGLSGVGSALATYTANYTSSDTAPIMIDTGNQFVVGFQPFIAIFVLLVAIYAGARIWKAV